MLGQNRSNTKSKSRIHSLLFEGPVKDFHVQGRSSCWCLNPSTCWFLTQNPVSALQFESVFAAAEVVDEVSQLVYVFQTLRHHHLLMDQVGLGQVGSSLDTKHTDISCLHAFTIRVVAQQWLTGDLVDDKETLKPLSFTPYIWNHSG